MRPPGFFRNRCAKCGEELKNGSTGYYRPNEKTGRFDLYCEKCAPVELLA